MFKIKILLPWFFLVLGFYHSAQAENSSNELYLQIGPRSYPVGPNFTGPSPYAAIKDAQVRQAIDSNIRKSISQNLSKKNGYDVAAVAVPKNLPTFEAEWLTTISNRLSDPATGDLARKFLQQALEGELARDPFQVLEGIDTYQNNLRKLRQVDPARAQKLTELGQGVVVDSQGLILGLPDAPRAVNLVSSASSESGISVRRGLNHLMVARQIIDGEYRVFCEKAGSAACAAQEADLAQFHSNYDEISFGYALADRLGIYKPDQFGALVTELNKVTEFYFGIAQGFLKEGAQSILITAQLATHPLAIVTATIALCDALIHWDRSLKVIKEMVRRDYDVLINGTREEAGKIIGKIGFQIVENLFPPLKAGAAFKIVRHFAEAAEKGSYRMVHRAIERAATEVAVTEKIGEVLNAGRITPAQSETLTRIAETFPRVAAEVLTDPKKLERLVDTAEGFGTKLKPSEKIAGLADRQVASLVKTDADVVLPYLKEFGPQATAGLAILGQESFLSEIAAWGAHQKLDDLAKLSREVNRTGNTLPSKQTIENTRSLFSTMLENSNRGEVLTESARSYLVVRSLLAPVGESKVGGLTNWQELIAQISQIPPPARKNILGALTETRQYSPRTLPDVVKASGYASELVQQISMERPHDLSRLSDVMNRAKNVTVIHRYGNDSVQEMSLAAILVRDRIERGAPVYRQGVHRKVDGRTQIVEELGSKNTPPRASFEDSPDFWAEKNPGTFKTPKDFYDHYGAYTIKPPDFIEMGEPVGPFITRRAERVETPEGVVTPGGGIEIVVPPGSVKNVRYVNVKDSEIQRNAKPMGDK